jgi:hypothetical protein
MSATQYPVSRPGGHGPTKHVIPDHEIVATSDSKEEDDHDNDLEVDLNANMKESEAADLSLGISMQSSIVSMRASLMESVQEHGRTYGKYKQGAYYMPNNKVEQDRLDMQHPTILPLPK